MPSINTSGTPAYLMAYICATEMKQKKTIFSFKTKFKTGFGIPHSRGVETVHLERIFLREINAKMRTCTEKKQNLSLTSMGEMG
jgi:hypothetical protein